jgi:hypothetical protein
MPISHRSPRSPIEGRLRPPAVAGLFYPSDPGELTSMVCTMMDAADPALRDAAAKQSGWPKAIIGPHAGYRYSGPIAASAYTPLLPARGKIRRVVLIGPAHRVAFTGVALPSAEAFAMPGRDFPLDREALDTAAALPGVHVLDHPHAPEHGLEVHLPWIAAALGPPASSTTDTAGYRVAPMLFGDVDHEAVADVLDALWGGPETLIVISSDLSHYLDYDTAKQVDHATSRSILAGEARRVGPSQACGHTAIRALMRVAERRRLPADVLDLRNSGDTAGPRNEVVGYGAFAFN